MADPWPFTQHLDTNYVPTSEELDELKALVAEREAVIDAIDAEMAELERKRTANAQYVRRLRTLATPVRRLPDDILLAIFFQSLALAEPWTSPHPSVVASHVCRRWRGLALGTPLLWTRIEIYFALNSLWGRVCDLNPSLPHMDIGPYVGPFLSLCRRSLCSLAEKVRMFTQRSSGCPLHLKALAYDDPHFESPFGIWSEMFEPLAEVTSDPAIRWENISLDLRVVPACSLALHFVRIPAASSRLGMRSVTLHLAASGSIPEARWNEVLLLHEGKVDLSSAQLSSLSVRMEYADMCRVWTTWGSLTTLTFGSTFISRFLPQEALNILRLTPRLIHCTIHFFIPSPQGTPPLHFLTLSHLESLTIIGDVPPRAFAAALHLPALTRLWTDGATSLAEGADTSAVCLWIERHGTQLTGVSIAHSSLTKHALGAALTNLPNVESLGLSFNPKNGPMALMNIGMGFIANEPDVLMMLDPGNAGGCPCPKLRKVDLKLWDGSAEQTANAMVDLVEKRRSVDRPSSIARLDKLHVSFRVLPQRNIALDLERKGIDTDGVSIRVESN